MKNLCCKNFILFCCLSFIFSSTLIAQDLSQGLMINDLEIHPMQDIAKPAYLESIVDPSFGTTIRRISNAGPGGVIKPMYSTIQAWNADESLMIVYDQSNSVHQLLDGMTYQFIRNLDDFWPKDIEEIFWDFEDPEIFYYVDSQTDDFIRYTVSSATKNMLFNLSTLSGCTQGVGMGNDIQMQSWDNDVFTFRCGNETNYSYRISTEELLELSTTDVAYTAASVGPSGDRFFHRNKVYNDVGMLEASLNASSTEHSCIGKLSNGNDAHFAVSFAEGPNGGCLGNIIAHDLTTGVCFPLISQDQGYDYSQSGTHISAVAHKNTEGGWLAASMVGFNEDGESLLDQELVVVKAEQGNVKVCRIGHHRSDENEFNYWGEPHATISPSGTRVLFASDWSGSEDGQSVDSYVVELPSFTTTTSVVQTDFPHSFISVSPNPVETGSRLTFRGLTNTDNLKVQITDLVGKTKIVKQLNSNQIDLVAKMSSGVYYYQIFDNTQRIANGSFVVR